jgi:hypothetical protein
VGVGVGVGAVVWYGACGWGVRGVYIHTHLCSCMLITSSRTHEVSSLTCIRAQSIQKNVRTIIMVLKKTRQKLMKGLQLMFVRRLHLNGSSHVYHGSATKK